MEATLLSTLMLLVEELPVKTGEDLHGFALPLSDLLYGGFGQILAVLRERFRPDPNTPESQHYLGRIRQEWSVAIRRVFSDVADIGGNWTLCRR